MRAFPFVVSFFAIIFVIIFVWLNFANVPVLLVKFFYGSLHQSEIVQDLVGAAQTEEQPDKNSSQEEYFDWPVVISQQAISVGDQLDDIQEKLDVIKQQIQELVEVQNQEDNPPKDPPEDLPEENIEEDDTLQESQTTIEENICPGGININSAVLADLGIEGEKLTAHRGKGCDNCKKTGFIGRSGIFEFLLINEEIRKMINEKNSADQIKKKAIELGMKTLRDDGLDKVRSGVTTIEEIMRVTEIE